MSLENKEKTGESPPVSTEYAIFEKLEQPICITGVDGQLHFANNSFKDLFATTEQTAQLDLKHPFFPEYRKRVALAYIQALNGNDKQCFAIINAPNGNSVPVEIYLFPMVSSGNVTAILTILKIVDERLLSFDRSTLTLISEENFQYDKLHFEFSPMAILRFDEEMKIIQCSRSCEGFLGYSNPELIEKQKVKYSSLFTYDAERIKKSVMDIFAGVTPFQRFGEVKVKVNGDIEKIINVVLYPIVQNQQINSIEVIMEDITRIIELKDKIASMNRIQLLSDITKGFMHTLNNSINVIMSKTQLISQITEKEPVLDGINLIEESAQEIIDQIRRVQNFIGQNDVEEDVQEPLVRIIEDAIEFSKILFKVEDNENRRSIEIDKKYFTSAYIKANTRALREIIIWTIIKVSNFIQKKGKLQIDLKENKDITLTVKAKEPNPQNSQQTFSSIDMFLNMDIRQVAEKVNIKIIEEETQDSYSIKAVIPSKYIKVAEVNKSEEVRYKLRDLDIIIVEDEKALKTILYELFDKMGNRVFVCEDGKDALEEFKRKDYDLVITDYGISGISGIELSARIKEINDKTVTVLLSGWVLNDLNVYKNVIDLFLPKPFKLDDLLTKISKIFKEKQE